MAAAMCQLPTRHGFDALGRLDEARDDHRRESLEGPVEREDRRRGRERASNRDPPLLTSGQVEASPGRELLKLGKKPSVRSSSKRLPPAARPPSTCATSCASW
jgi:hypothetical protein